MYRGEFSGFFAWGQNPACSGANAAKTREALTRLDWMVNVNLFDNETASFWKGPGMDPGKVKTEVFFLPCAAFMEKEGSITNSGAGPSGATRLRIRRERPSPTAISMVELFNEIRSLYAKEGGAFPDPILNLKWDYTTDGKFDAHKVARTINGEFTRDVTIKDKTYKKGQLVPSFAFLQADGSTTSGNWLYCQSYNESGNNMARRDTTDASGIGLYSNWAWCWPVNRRILYNRASVDLTGRPWNPKKPVIAFAGEVKDGKYVTNKWVGDVPDGGWYPMMNPDGTLRTDTKYPFIMKPHGFGGIFGPGRNDGPFPEHYEPIECPVEKNLFSSQFTNPVAAFTARKRTSTRRAIPGIPSWVPPTG